MRTEFRDTALPGRSVEIAGVRFLKTIVVLPAIATLILSVAFWQGMRATDDLGYAAVAMSMVPGGSPPLFQQRNHHETRIGVTYPLAVVLSVFGTGDVSLAILPLVCSVLTASLIAWLAWWFWGAAVGLSAGLLYAVFPLTIDLSTFLVPEPILGFEICLAIALFLWAVERETRNAALVEFFAGVIIGIAYLTTEVGALMLPALYLYLLISRRIRLRDAWLLAGFMAVFCAELAYHTAVHGNPFHRFTFAAGYLVDPMLVAANRDLTYRLLKTIPAMFTYPNLNFGFLGPLLVVAGFYGLLRWRQSLLFVIWAAVILLFYNFMTVSFRHYVALPVTARLLAPACLPLVILSGKLLVDLWVCIARCSAGFVRYSGRALFAASALGLTLASLMVMYLNTSPTFTEAVARNAKQAAGFLRGHPSVTLITDQRSAMAMQFYRHYSPRDSFFSFAAASRLGSRLQDDPGKPVFVVLNGPIINEKVITGQRYGEGFLGSEDSDSLSEFLPGQEAEVLSAQLRRGPLFETLFRYAPIRSLMGQWAYRLGEQLFATIPPLGEVQVFRYSQSRGNPKQPDSLGQRVGQMTSFAI